MESAWRDLGSFLKNGRQTEKKSRRHLELEWLKAEKALRRRWQSAKEDEKVLCFSVMGGVEGTCEEPSPCQEY